ncbi:MAG: class I adenylate-forming enzyme family protein [Gammaproteobacteria bacterium]|nr:class I adenylate-forming enzyme family protein [Gammaproteobacteria bacterium]
MVSVEYQQAIDQITSQGQPYETVNVVVDGVEFLGFKNAPKNLRALYENALSFESDFYVYENERYTFQQAWSTAAKVANRLQRLGIQPGDRVGISCRNYPEWIFAFMGITAAGCVAVAMNAWWSEEEMVYGIEHSGLKLLFADSERVERIHQQVESLGIQLVTIRSEQAPHESWEDFVAEQSDLMPEVDIDPDANATLMYTSGSTAHPKGVLSKHRSICNALMGWEAGGMIGMQAMRNAGSELPAPTEPPKFKPSMILSVPLFHVTGLTVQFLSTFRFGRKLVGMYKWDVEEALKIIERERITSFNGVPTMSYELVKSEKLNDYDLSSLQSAGGGGAAMAPEHAREINKKISQGASGTGWGMTETQGLGTSIGGEAYMRRPKSCGRAIPPLVRVKAIDDAGTELAANETGELCIWGIQNFSGYWRNERATEETLVDGWVHTGDIGHVDSEGYVFITDRKKDIVIRGGENIGCQEVEAALYEHPDINEACVFGIPDERLGEILGCVVSVNPDSMPTIDAIKAFARQHLSYHKVPEQIWVQTERLPRTASEKIFKRQIRTDILQELGFEV